MSAFQVEIRRVERGIVKLGRRLSVAVETRSNRPH